MSDDRPDQRSTPRYPAAGRVLVCLVTVAGEPVADGTVTCGTGDVSLRGVCLELEYPLTVNDKVQMQVQLVSDGKVFPHTGRVAWCHPAAAPGRYNAGIAFMTTPGPALNEWRVALLSLFE